MAGFSSLADFIEEMTVNEQVLHAEFNKISGLGSLTVGRFYSLWKNGPMPPAGSDPATTPGTAYDNDDAGVAVGGWADQDPDKKFLTSVSAVSGDHYVLFVYDRLVGVGGISTTTTGNKTISSTALPRYTDGVGVQCWLECTTGFTVTTPVVALNSYTDEDGNTGQAGGNYTLNLGTSTTQLFGPLPLAAGDRGLQAVSTLNVVTASSVGVVNLLLIKPLAIVPLRTDQGNRFDFMHMLPTFPRIYDGATLGLAIWCSNGNIARVHGEMTAVYG